MVTASAVDFVIWITLGPKQYAAGARRNSLQQKSLRAL
jgi:hypothetical protein